MTSAETVSRPVFSQADGRLRPATDALIFDLFSTLISAAPAAGSTGSHTADILGVDRRHWNRACFSDHHEICRPTRHLEIIRCLAHSIDPAIPEALIEQATAERQQRFDHALQRVEPEILQTLKSMRRRGIRLGLISNASTGEVSAWPDSPLASMFDSVLFSCHCGMKKPQPAIYRESLQQLGVKPAQALFIGDGGSNEHQGAAQVGIPSLLVTHFLGHRSNQELSRLGTGSNGRIGHIRDLLSRD